jgi:LuxR family transcriptional regulator, glucitol operon activator
MTPARTATRLTCFALISAIEKDLRNSIRFAVTQIGRDDVFPADVKEQVRKRCDQDRGDSDDALLEQDIDFLDYIGFEDIAKIIYGIASDWGVVDKIQANALADRLVTLTPIRNRVCHAMTSPRF